MLSISVSLEAGSFDIIQILCAESVDFKGFLYRTNQLMWTLFSKQYFTKSAKLPVSFDLLSNGQFFLYVQENFCWI